MKNTLFTALIVIYSLAKGYGQFKIGQSYLYGIPFGANPHGIHVRPVAWDYSTFEYHWPKVALVAEINPILTSEVDYDNKVDRTAFTEIDFGTSAPFLFPYNQSERVRLVAGIWVTYKKIHDDFFIESYTLDLQSGHRLGIAGKTVLEFQTNDI